MRRLLAAVVFLLVLSGAPDLRSQVSREFLFAASRSGIAEVVDAATLETVASIHFDFHVERLSANADGTKLYVAGYSTGAPCCKHYTLDPTTLKLEEEVPSSDRSGYGECLISPNGNWCFRLRSFRGPALRTVYRLASGPAFELIPRNLPAEDDSGNWYAQGVWSGNRFYLYVARPDDPGRLWTVLPGADSLGDGIPVAPFNEAPDCRRRLPTSKNLVAAGDNLFLYEPFGNGSKGSRLCQSLPGGAWVVEPATGRLLNQVAPELHFGEMVSDPRYAVLYGVAPGDSTGGPVQLVRIEAVGGKVTKSRNFDAGESLSISVGPLSDPPAGDVTARPTSSDR